MKFNISADAIESAKEEVIILPLLKNERPPEFKAIDGKIKNELSRIIKSKEFEGDLYQAKLINTLGHMGAKAILIVGLGEENKFRESMYVEAMANAAAVAKSAGYKSVAIKSDQAEQVVRGTILGNYVFDKYKTDKEKGKKAIEQVTIYTSSAAKAKSGARKGQIIGEAQNFARNLGNESGEGGTPTTLTQAVKKAAKESGFKLTVYDEKDMKKMGMNGILSVAKGSDEPAKFLVMEYMRGKSKDAHVFVGKGITFDSGGINLKSSQHINNMKHDKCGAAAVIGAMKAIADLGLKVNIVGLVAFTENMPSGKATKPDDIVTMHNGKTVEVVNTDAEGRMILADMLSYAQKYKPKSVIELSTLTGACLIALGKSAAGLMTNDYDLGAKLFELSEQTGDRVWELPLWDEYGYLMKSKVADLKNLGHTGGYAGTITAAAFLKEFTDYKYAHIDIAGVAYKEGVMEFENQPAFPQGATGFGVNLLTKYAEDVSQ